jgi:hypothetical protein
MGRFAVNGINLAYEERERDDARAERLRILEQASR